MTESWKNKFYWERNWHREAFEHEVEGAEEPKFDEPITSKYWNRIALKDGKRIIGHQMTPGELYEFNRSLYCGAIDWIEQDGIIWRYYLD